MSISCPHRIGTIKQAILLHAQNLSRRAKTFRVACSNATLLPRFFLPLVNCKLRVIRIPVAEQVISMLKSDLRNPSKYSNWLGFLYRRVMSPKAVLAAVQLCLFPYFHLRNNEIYSLLYGTTLLWAEEGYLDCTPCAQTIFPPIFIPDGLKRKI